MVKKRKTSPILILGIVLLVIAIILGIYSVTSTADSKKCVNDADCPQPRCFGMKAVCENGKCKTVDTETGQEMRCGERITDFVSCVKARGDVMESYPRQCRYEDMVFVEEHCQSDEGVLLTLENAKTSCEDEGIALKETFVCNSNTGTYWIDADIEKEGCNPACVVDLETREAEINWRCTGLIE